MNEQDYKQKLINYKNVFGSESGLKVLEDLKIVCSYNNHCVGKDQYETYFRLGERNVILRILKILETTPDKLEQLSREQSEE